LISGIPQEAGIFNVSIGASNSGGADTRELAITSLPVLENQALNPHRGCSRERLIITAARHRESSSRHPAIPHRA
jgi:hypothetical protein